MTSAHPPEPRAMPPWLARVLMPWLEVPDRLHRMEIAMATQADIDNLTQKLTGLRAALDTGNTRIQAEIERLRGLDVDVTELEAAVSELGTEVDEAVGLVPAADTGGGETPTDPAPVDPAPVDPSDPGAVDQAPLAPGVGEQDPTVQ